jgi:hypothetical protein
MAIAVFTLLAGGLPASAADLDLRLARRDPETGVPREETIRLDSGRLAVVVVDMWNWHWCKTAAARVGALVPRMELVLRELRGLGVQVCFCPTDSVDAYVGTPQRERVFAVDPVPLPDPVLVECPEPPNGPGCACIERCRVNYGWNAMHPGLTIAAADLMPNSRETLYSLLRARGTTHILYMGVHTQVCLLGKDVGLRNMKALGFECILARDLTDSHPDYDPANGIDPDGLTQRTIEHFERWLCATIDAKAELERLGHWPHDEPVDPVRAAPWGTRERPHLFEERTIVTLSFPADRGAEIRFTADGGDPGPESPLYAGPFELVDSADLRVAAFRDGRVTSLPTRLVYAKLAPRPPRPDIAIGDLKARRFAGPGHSPSDSSHRYSPVSGPPQVDRTNRGQALRLHDRVYRHGMGVHAPNHMIYDVDPSWGRFVALAGMDEYILDTELGSDLARVPSAIFRVFIDGEPVAESPVQRCATKAWRFDVRIPEGAKIISLAVDPTADGNREDLANWVNAGFILRGSEGTRDLVEVPGEIEELAGARDGFAWCRSFVRVPDGFDRERIVLEIPVIDDSDEVYWNGAIIGRTGTMPPAPYRSGTDTPRSYPVPARLLSASGWNTIAVRIFDGGGAAGIRIHVPYISDGSKRLDLSGEWEYSIGDDATWSRPIEDAERIRRSRARFGADSVVRSEERGREHQYRLATFAADVTIPIGHRCMGVLPTKAARIDDPLEARGFVLLGGAAPLVYVAVDWCEIRNDSYDEWRDALAKTAETTRERVIVSSLHQHDAPVVDTGAEALLASVGLAGELFDRDFHATALARVASALRAAIPSAEPITHIGLGEARVEGVASNRRVVRESGVVEFSRGSSSARDPFHRDAPEGLHDPVLATLSLWNGDRALVELHSYATHPMSHYGKGGVSADFVGIARRLRQAEVPAVFQIYATGASGDVTAGKFNDGAPEQRGVLAERIRRAMEESSRATRRHELREISFRVAALDLEFIDDPRFTRAALETRLRDSGASVEERILASMGLSSRSRVDAGRSIDVPCIDFGVARLLLLPGESFVGFQLLAKSLRPDSFVMTIGYGECWTGYVPTESAFADGFGTDWRWVARGSEAKLRTALEELLLPEPARAGEPDTERESPPKPRVLLGAHYYPWYRGVSPPASARGEIGWMRRALRGRLLPRQLPALGVYDSRDPAVIGAHIAQSERARIDFWSVSWWGPDGREDRTLRDHILPHPDAGKLRYAILYESTGRLGSFERPDYSNWVSDFEYLRKTYFGHPRYLKLDGKPVVFVYLTREYFRDRGLEALSRLRDAVPDLYIVGDEIFGPQYHERHAKLFDAVTAYDVYGQSTRIDGGTLAAIDRLKSNYESARAIAHGVGTAFVPAIGPSYNDRAVREGHPGRSRVLSDREGSAEGDLFREMIRRIALPLSDPRAERMVLVTSFNEWYEDTQIEATGGTAGSTAKDDSDSGSFYTEGETYEDYGTLYLDILREELRDRESAVPSDSKAERRPEGDPSKSAESTESGRD